MNRIAWIFLPHYFVPLLTLDLFSQKKTLGLKYGEKKD